MNYILILAAAFLGALGQLFFKLGAPQFSLSLDLIYNWKFILGLTLYGLATVLFMFALKNSNLSLAYPLIATSYIWVPILSLAFLAEPFPMYKWVGIFFILLGVVVISG